MGKIRILKEEVYRKIAAGEVIERPVSVVKELVENALDAGADTVRVALLHGGKDLVRVEDNGEGFAAEDIELAFSRHATSKLSELSDLDALQTLGFRGEALPSLLEVSDIVLKTSNREDGQGLECVFAEGRRQTRRRIAFGRGTTIEVRRLFHNLPVRRKFLKSDASEFNQLVNWLEQIVLAHPEAAFELENGGKKVFSFAKAGRLQERIYQVFGRQFLQELTEVEHADNGYAVHGFVSQARTGLASKNRQHFVVNGRPVREKTLIAAFNRTYEGFLEKGKFPAGILLFTMPPADLDVNIHPMKLEIRFRDSGHIFRFINAALQKVLQGETAWPADGADLNATAPAVFARSQTLPRAGTAPLLVEMPAAEKDAFQLLGQYHFSYIVIEKEGQLLVVDQHNAQERVIFEKLRREYADNQILSVPTLFPVIFDLTPSEKAGLSERKLEFLARSGFDLRLLSGQTVEVKAFPQLLAERTIRETVLAVVGLAADELEMENRWLAEMACQSAVKVNQPLGAEQMKTIVRELFATANPHLCPHQRPIIVPIGLEEIEKRLKRR